MSDPTFDQICAMPQCGRALGDHTVREMSEHTNVDLAYEDNPQPTSAPAGTTGFMAGRLTCLAATLGAGGMLFPAIIFRFHGEDEDRSCTLVLTEGVMATLERMITDTARGAIRAARR